MEAYEPFISFALAFASGLLMGMERQQARRPDDDASFHGGVRTYPIFSLMGGVAAFGSRHWGVGLLLLVSAGVFGFIAISYVRDVQRGHVGLTREGAFLLSYLLGVLALTPEPFGDIRQRVLVVSALAIGATVMMSARAPLHSLISSFSQDDVFATLKFLIVAVVVLPLLPNEPLGPYGVLNPFKVGLMVVLLAGVSFAGYVATRALGPGRGMLLTAAVGGLASSTAVTLAAANRAKQSPGLSTVAALSIGLASAIMCVRMVVLVTATNQQLAPLVARPLVAMALAAGLVVAVVFWRQGKRQTTDGVTLSNPFELSSAVKLAALVVAVLLVSRWASEQFGTGAVYVTALLAGITDVDAITLSAAQLSSAGQLAAPAAAITIFLAAASNTVAKAAMAFAIGGWGLAKVVFVALGLQLLAGAAAALTL